MEKLEATLNSCVPGRTHKQYYKDNAEKIKQYNKNNSEKIKEYQKQYGKNNSEKIKEYAKEYYQNNIEKIKEQTECEFCHSFVRKDNLSRHHKSKKCLATR